jgi:hypothetical protein
MDPHPSPEEIRDADGLLKDWGKNLECAAAPLVTRGLVDRVVIERPAGEGSVMSKQIVLKVRTGSFDGIAVRGTRVAVTDQQARTLQYAIDQELPSDTGLFDFFALQPWRTTP